MKGLSEDQSLLVEFVNTLDESCRELESSAEYLSRNLSSEFLEELNEYLEGALSADDEEGLRSEIGWTEKKLLWTLARLRKLRRLRLSITRDWMRTRSPAMVNREDIE